MTTENLTPKEMFASLFKRKILKIKLIVIEKMLINKVTKF